jgi:lipopolysaccharide export system protein LptA
MSRFFSILRAVSMPLLIAGTLVGGCGRKPAETAKEKNAAEERESARRGRSPGVIKGFAANLTDNKGQTFQIRSENAVPLGNDVFSITNMVIQTERNGSPDMTIEAPHCIWDSKNSTSSSPGEMAVRTADGRLAVRGRGFLFLQQGSSLVISNAVQTEVLKRPFRTAAPSAATGPRTAPVSGATNAEMIRVVSDRLDYRTDLALFTGNVRATEPGLQLTCGALGVHFRPGGTNRIERIDASENVVFNQGTGRATGDRVVYVPQETGDVIELSGHANWTDPQRQAAAETLTLDRTRNILRAAGNARLRVPRRNLDTVGVLIASPVATPAPAGTNSFVDLSSRLMTLKFASTNGALEKLEAEGDVVIASLEDQTRATGQKLVYDERLGSGELTGKPVWQNGGRLVEGDTLAFERTNRLFAARGGAHVRLPVATLGQSSLLAPNPVLKMGAAAATNRIVEVFADQFEYRTNRMNFDRNVRAQLLEGRDKRAELETAALQIDSGKRLERIVASGGARVRQFPAPDAKDRRVTREFSGETLRMEMDAEGRLASLNLDRNVKGEQTVVRSGKTAPVQTRFASETVTAKFAALSNHLDTVLAERHVTIEQDGRAAQGDHAVFDGATQVLELTGQAKARFPEGRVTAADVLAWDAARERLMVRGKFKSEWQRPGSKPAADAPATSR